MVGGLVCKTSLCEFESHRCLNLTTTYDYPNNFNLSLIEDKGWYKPKNRGDNPNGISRDHMVSVSFAFKNGILPYYICHPANCRLMAHSQNNKKNSECSITFEELLKRIDKWDNK